MTGDEVLPLGYFTNWLASGERGLSSEAIVSHLTGMPVGRDPRPHSYPLDPSDFRRCQLLLTTHPLAAASFGRMREVSPQWHRLVDAWDEIHAVIEVEVPGYVSSNRGSAPKAFQLMRSVIDGREVLL